LHASNLQHERNSIRAQQFDYKEILPDQQYPFRDGQKYGLTIKAEIGPREKKASYYSDSDEYKLIRPITVNIMKGRQLILSEIFEMTGDSSELVNNTLDYATPTKYIVNDYKIAESNGVVYLFQSYDSDINKLLPRGKPHIAIYRPRINSIRLSIDDGANWVPIELYSAKIKDKLLFRTDGLLNRIVSIEPLSGDKNYLKVGLVKAYFVGDQPEYFNFKRVNDRYQIE
jgi:hypothetical protein